MAETTADLRDSRSAARSGSDVDSLALWSEQTQQFDWSGAGAAEPAPVEVRLGDHVLGTRIEADSTGATAVAGLWVAGNVADLQAQVVTSAASGLSAAAAINADLIGEDARRAVEKQRSDARASPALSP